MKTAGRRNVQVVRRGVQVEVVGGEEGAARCKHLVTKIRVDESLASLLCFLKTVAMRRFLAENYYTTAANVDLAHTKEHMRL